MMNRTALLHKGVYKLLAVAMLTALMSAFVAAPIVASANTADKDTSNDATLEVTGTGTTASGESVSLAGDLAIAEIVDLDGQLVTVGTLTGTLTDTAGDVLQTVTDLPVELPLQDATGDCAAVHLGLGPLDLDALGTGVHLDRVALDVTAESDSGGLLGDLLCTVGDLLDSATSSNVLAMLLNLLLPILG